VQIIYRTKNSHEAAGVERGVRKLTLVQQN